MIKIKSVFYGWWVALASTTIHTLGSGIFFYGFSVFFVPIISEYGWSSLVMGGAFALSRLEGGLEGPVIGYLIDRFGSRKLLIVGLFIAGLFFTLMPLIDTVWKMYLIYLIISIGYNTGCTHALIATVANWFIKKRSRAMMMYALGAGIGGATIVPIMSRLITMFGWRTTAMIAGISLWVIGFPMAKFITHRPEDRNLLPDGPSHDESSIPPSTAVQSELSGSKLEDLEVDFTVKLAVRTKTFWIYLLFLFFRSFLLSSLVIYQIPHLVNIGISQETAGDILGLTIFVSLLGRFVFGWVGDFYPKRYLISLACLMQCVGILFLSNAQNVIPVYFFVLIYGVGYGGAIPLMSAFIGDLFGRKSFATIRGLTTPVGMIGSTAGPLFAGYIFDMSQSYKSAFDTFAILAVMAATTSIFVRKPKPSLRVNR